MANFRDHAAPSLESKRLGVDGGQHDCRRRSYPRAEDAAASIGSASVGAMVAAVA